MKFPCFHENLYIRPYKDYLKCKNFREDLFLWAPKTSISRRFIFTKQTRYGIKQKSKWRKINENVTK